MLNRASDRAAILLIRVLRKEGNTYEYIRGIRLDCKHCVTDCWYFEFKK